MSGSPDDTLIQQVLEKSGASDAFERARAVREALHETNVSFEDTETGAPFDALEDAETEQPAPRPRHRTGKPVAAPQMSWLALTVIAYLGGSTFMGMAWQALLVARYTSWAVPAVVVALLLGFGIGWWVWGRPRLLEQQGALA